MVHVWHVLSAMLLSTPSADLCAGCVRSYRIEQELGTEIKPIPPTIEKSLYCA